MPSTKKKSRSKRTKQAVTTETASDEQAARTPVEVLFGRNTLLKSVDADPQATTTLLPPKTIPLVAIYFAAGDDAACRAFTPRLIELYEAAAAASKPKQKQLEVVFVSSDPTVAQFEAYYRDMPWLSFSSADEVRDQKNSLAKTLAVSSIPTVIVLTTATGQVVADDNVVARIEECCNSSNKQDPADSSSFQKLLDEWHQTEPVDIAAAVDRRVKQQMTWASFFKTLLRQIVLMFVILQLTTHGMRFMKTMIHGHPPHGATPSIAPQAPPVQHAEF